ncbi:hypothetical protein [Tenacibaculum jejuense]|uniref:Hypothetical lipoprotein n=1 Tax=Tenacibaculum jejuense TaxID=584609 RepID=A0A238UFA1_9FLAO|nr:hypothetical protein [Tenacibaculum jejuense]SNR17258.1 Hypothetical lipoprotein precursor [Tenacibaculum jejuense]
MKKVILSIFLVGALTATSCKKAKEASEEVKQTTETTVKKTEEAATKATEETKAAAEETAKKVESALEGVTIPEFKDPKVAEYLKTYTEYAKEYIDANGDVSKISKLAAKGQELATKAQTFTSSLDAEDAKKLSSTIQSIMSKMAPKQ